MIHLDTNYLIMAMVAGSSGEQRLREWLASREVINVSVVVWTEFLCGPLTADQVTLATSLFPAPEPLLAIDSARAADLFNSTGRRRGSLADCMIAATCIRVGASLATENRDDFRQFELSGLRLLQP